MVELSASEEVLGQKVTIRVTIEPVDLLDAGKPREEAISRIQNVMGREVRRMAEIAGVDVKDQPIELAEAKRIRALPKTRSHVTVASGTKDPNAAVVHRGSVNVGGRMQHAGKAK